MAKFYGPIGYAVPVETRPGIWGHEIVERNAYGDVIEVTSTWSTSSDSVNDDLNIEKRISIVADPYAYQNFHRMKYVEYLGAKWKIKSVKPAYPRLILNIGGVYNGKQA